MARLIEQPDATSLPTPAGNPPGQKMETLKPMEKKPRMRSFKVFMKTQNYTPLATVPFKEKKGAKKDVAPGLTNSDVMKMQGGEGTGGMNAIGEEALTEKTHGETPPTFLDSDRKAPVVDKLHKRLTDHYFFDDNDKKGLSALADYHTDMNKHLQTKSKGKPERSKEPVQKPEEAEQEKALDTTVQGAVKQIDAMLGQHVSPSAEFFVYLPLMDDPRNSAEAGTGVKPDDKGEIRGEFVHFASSSISPAVAKQIANLRRTFESDKNVHILKVKIPGKTKHGVYVGDNSPHSDEKEFLMRPNRKVHINPEPEIHDLDPKAKMDADGDFDGDEKMPPKGKKDEKQGKKLHIWHGELQGK